MVQTWVRAWCRHGSEHGADMGARAWCRDGSEPGAEMGQSFVQRWARAWCRHGSEHGAEMGARHVKMCRSKPSHLAMPTRRSPKFPIQSYRSFVPYSHFALVSDTVILLLYPIRSFRFCVRYGHFALVSDTVISLLRPIQSFRFCVQYSHFALVPDTVNFALVLTSGGYLLTQTCFLTSNLLLHSVPPLRSRDLSARHTRGNDVIDCNTSEIAADKDIKKHYRPPGEARRGHEKGLKLTLEI